MILKLTCMNAACGFAGTLYDFNRDLLRRREAGPLYCPSCDGYLYSILDEDYVMVDIPRLLEDSPKGRDCKQIDTTSLELPDNIL